MRIEEPDKSFNSPFRFRHQIRGKFNIETQTLILELIKLILNLDLIFFHDEDSAIRCKVLPPPLLLNGGEVFLAANVFARLRHCVSSDLRPSATGCWWKLQIATWNANMQHGHWSEVSLDPDIYDYHDGHKRQLFSRLTIGLLPQDIVVTKTDRGNSSGFSHCHLSLNAAHLNFLQTRPHCFLSWTCSLTMFTQRLPLVTTKFFTRVFFLCLFLLPPTSQLLWSNPGSSRCYTCASSAHWPSVAAPPHENRSSAEARCSTARQRASPPNSWSSCRIIFFGWMRNEDTNLMTP